MTKFDRSAQIWPLLVLSARNQQILSYTTVERLTGLQKYTLAQYLGPIWAYCDQHNFPILTSIVVSQAKGLPSGGLPKGVVAFEEQARAFVFDWLGKEKETPSSEDFETAWSKVKPEAAPHFEPEP